MLTQQTIRHLNHREGSKSRIDRTTKNLLSLSRWIFARNRFTPCLSLSFSFSPMGYDRTTRTRRRQATRQDTRVIRGRGRETIHQQEPPRGCYPLPSVSSAIGRLSPPGEYANFSGGVERDRDSMIRAKVPWCAATAVFFYFFLFFFFFFFFLLQQLPRQWRQSDADADHPADANGRQLFSMARWQFVCSARVRTSWKLVGGGWRI